MNLVAAPGWQQYVASLYFVTYTLTTVGYGDITPVTPAEQIVATCIMLVGIVFFGLVISSSQYALLCDFDSCLKLCRMAFGLMPHLLVEFLRERVRAVLSL
jgi:hypothetical protein